MEMEVRNFKNIFMNLNLLRKINLKEGLK